MLGALSGTNTVNIGSLTSVFGMGTGVSNLLWPSSNFQDINDL